MATIMLIVWKAVSAFCIFDEMMILLLYILAVQIETESVSANKREWVEEKSIVLLLNREAFFFWFSSNL